MPPAHDPGSHAAPTCSPAALGDSPRVVPGAGAAPCPGSGRLHRRRRRRPARRDRAGRHFCATRPPRPSGVRRTGRRWRPWSGCSSSRRRSSARDADRALPGLVDDASRRRDCWSPRPARSARGLDCRPYADDGHDWWVVSDLTPGLDGQPMRVEADHVLGVTPASTSLAQLTTRGDRSARALDLGTGCGVQSLHLSTHADAGRRHRRQRPCARGHGVQRRPERRARSTSVRDRCGSRSPPRPSTWSPPTRRS